MRCSVLARGLAGLTALLAGVAHAQTAAPADSVLAVALDAMQQTAYYASRVDWPAVRARAHARVAADPGATHAAIREALAALGDGHSFLIAPDPEDAAPAPAGEAPRVAATLLRGLHGHVIAGARGPVGYVRVPFVWGGGEPAQRVADSLLAIVRRLDAARPVGWIVDVRFNGGGNIWPMLAGLAPLLGDGVVGGDVTADGTRSWVRLDGPAALYVAPDTTLEVMRTAETYRFASPAAPVAVLTDGATASSAEGVALAFAGRARRVGEATAGLSSSNEGLRLPDGSTLVLTTGLMLDGAGQAYGGALAPDTAAPDDPATVADETLDAALAWLAGQR